MTYYDENGTLHIDAADCDHVAQAICRALDVHEDDYIGKYYSHEQTDLNDGFTLGRDGNDFEGGEFEICEWEGSGLFAVNKDARNPMTRGFGVPFAKLKIEADELVIDYILTENF